VLDIDRIFHTLLQRPTEKFTSISIVDGDNTKVNRDFLITIGTSSNLTFYHHHAFLNSTPGCLSYGENGLGARGSTTNHSRRKSSCGSPGKGVHVQQSLLQLPLHRLRFDDRIHVLVEGDHGEYQVCPDLDMFGQRHATILRYSIGELGELQEACSVLTYLQQET
jgi:hypothetical protein